MPDQNNFHYEIECLSYTTFTFISSKAIKVDSDSIMTEKRTADLRKLALQTLDTVFGINILEMEFDWSKIRDLDFQESYQERNSLINQLPTFKASICPELDRHVF